MNIALLHPETEIQNINKYYITPYLQEYVDKLKIYSIHKEPKRTPSSLQKECLQELYKYFEQDNITILIICDAEYFKTITGVISIDKYLYYVIDSKDKKYKVIYCPSYKTIFYNKEDTETKIRRSLETFIEYYKGNYSVLGSDIINFHKTLETEEEIDLYFNEFINQNLILSSDIETYSLKFHEAGLASITFCWNQHEGITLLIDPNKETKNVFIRNKLKTFFENFKGKLIWHNCSFDIMVLIYQLFMKDSLDTVGLLYGLEIFTNNFEDTKIISYLMLNSTVKYSLSLKSLSHEFSGNYAIEEIKDISKIEPEKLLKYNLIDGLSTYYVYNKYINLLKEDEKQYHLYETLFKDTLKDIIQMQLTGLPLNIDKVNKSYNDLLEKEKIYLHEMKNNKLVIDFVYYLKEQWVIDKNSTYKKKRVCLEDCDIEFNSNSNIQLTDLLYNEKFLALPIIDYTDNKSPATGGDTLNKLLNHTTDENILSFLNNLIGYKEINKLITSFFPAFINSYKANDGHNYLFGFFNLGGTKSGRLSSNGPNLQNLPSTGTKYAKTVKECFASNDDWLFVGADFNSLEDRVSALQTKDPNKLKVYTDGYDGHCLRAYSYFGSQMLDINPMDIDSINSIDKKYKHLRQLSKPPTFALTYMGTWKTLVNNCGFTEELAKQIEKAYHDLYFVSDEYVANKLLEACETGYVELAFGLKLRTPLLKQVILNNSKTPNIASAEGRTAGNALGQSWGNLNNRACAEFMDKVRKSKFRLDIKPVAMIHDACYFLVRNDIEAIKFVNDNLIKAMSWQDDPKIYHDKVKLEAELSIFYPDWSQECKLDNYISEQEILDTFQKHYNKINNKE